jgi:gamma-glutamyl:cysteine ligase YbdK (ATP-grasp superfamily)
MGDEVGKDHFTDKDYQRFEQKLVQEMEFVRLLFAEKRFDNSTRKLGYELELCLLDPLGNPAGLNQKVLQQADNPLFTYELARYNLEINGHAFNVDSQVFQNIQADLEQLFHQIVKVTDDLQIEPGLFGVLPSLSHEYLDSEFYMSDMFRYRILNQRLMSMREQAVHVEIDGADHLQVERNDVMLEALGTSLQVHLQIPFDEAVDCYHAALWSSMAMLAVSANSPLVLGKSCWQESRIAIFKQSVDTRNALEIHDGIIPRVHLSKGYISSFLELFEDNEYYSPILPEVLDCPVEELHHFNLHNGTIWRWVRPILGADQGGAYHLRLELRVAPSGPTLIDTLANMVFYVGLTEGLRMEPQQLTRIPYADLEHDFYHVARNGLDAEVTWCNGKMLSMQQIILKYAIPTALAGLQNLGIDYPLQWLDIIQQRSTNAQTGARWMLNYWQKDPDAAALVQQYMQYARRNIPVHLWPSA